MMTVNEVSKLSGVSVRALHHYDKIGLLKPSAVTSAGYRLYDRKSIETLGQILLFKELGFSLSEIKKIINNPDFDAALALEKQIKLLTLKKEHTENLIALAKRIKEKGVFEMDFNEFNKQAETYQEKAKELWGNTEAYKEFDKKTANYSKTKFNILADEMMDIFKEFGKLSDKSPCDSAVQKKVKELKSFITDNYYTCTNEILLCLGQMYAAGGEMTDNIDLAGGKGTAKFVSSAINEYLK